LDGCVQLNATNPVPLMIPEILTTGARGSVLGLTRFAVMDVCFADSPVAFTAVTAI